MDALTPSLTSNDPDAQARSPFLHLDGFEGPLDMLLAAARAHEIDLALVSLPVLADQLLAALQTAVAIERKAEWVSIAAWLVLLRSRLMLPAERPEQQAAAAKAGALQDRLRELRAVQAGAAWLKARPQLGRDVFPRGRPELLGLSEETTWHLDVIEFFWAGMALFEDPADAADTAVTYAPSRPALFSVPEARARIFRRLRDAAGPLSLVAVLPDEDLGDAQMDPWLRRGSGAASTLVAALERVKQQRVRIEQGISLTTLPMLDLVVEHPA